MDEYTATEVAYKNGYNDGYAAGFAEGSQQNTSKYGMWERRGFNGHNCSCCGALNDIDTNFCPNCGARMNKET